MPDPRVEKLEKDIAALQQRCDEFFSNSGVTLAELKRGIETVNGHVADVLYELGGAPDHRFRKPDRPSIRDRLHVLENDRQAARIAGAALEAAQASRDASWGKWQKIGLFAFAGIGALGTIFSLVILIFQ